MRVVHKIGFMVLASSLLMAQSSQPADSDSSRMQKLLDAMAAQQKAIAEQQQQIAQQQQAISQQQQQIDQLKQQLTAQQSGQMVNASLTVANPSPVARTVSDVAVQEPVKESPLSFKIGGADFTPGGFMDFTAIFRSVNTGNLGTNFFNIPFSNTTVGHLTETRFTAQNSRVSLRAHDKFGENDVTGYLEMDFLGNDAQNVFVTSNSHTLRERLYFVDVKRHAWEILGGQSWSMLTPNRVGISPYPSDIFYSQNMDFNYQAGLTWTRAPQFRVIYHANDHWAVGVSLENPQQYTGGTVTFPNSFSAQIGSSGTNTQNGQFDANSGAGNNTDGNNTPNVHPDVIPKIAYDTDISGKHFHVEVAGLLSGFRVADLPTVTGATFVKHAKEGGGASAAINLEVVKNFRIVANGFYSDGGGRYIFGSGPDLVALITNAPGATCTNVATTTGTPPNTITTFSGAGCDVALSLVHSGSGILGFEAQVTPHTMLYGYYGGDYFQRNFGPDISGKPGTFIGYGGPNSSNSNNRAIQEGTIGWIQTFWKNPQYGALQLITQGSYLTRAPWFVAAGAPKNAHLGMGWVDLRYVLP